MTDIYVDPILGDNSYDGTVMVYVSGTTGPKKTITRGANSAWSIAQEGDIIHLNGGTYDETNQSTADYYENFDPASNGATASINATIKKWEESISDVTLAHNSTGTYTLRLKMVGVTLTFEDIHFAPSAAQTYFNSFDSYDMKTIFNNCSLDLDNITTAVVHSGTATNAEIELNDCDIEFDGTYFTRAVNGIKSLRFTRNGIDCSDMLYGTTLMDFGGTVEDFVFIGNTLNGSYNGIDFTGTNVNQVIIQSNNIVWDSKGDCTIIKSPQDGTENGNWIIDGNGFEQVGDANTIKCIHIGLVESIPDDTDKVIKSPKITNNTIKMLDASQSYGVLLGFNVDSAIVTDNKIYGGRRGIDDYSQKPTVTRNIEITGDPYLCRGAQYANVYNNTCISTDRAGDRRAIMMGANWCWGTYLEVGEITNVAFTGTTMAYDSTGTAWDLTNPKNAFDVWGVKVIAWVKQADGKYVYGYVTDIDDSTDTVTVDDWYEWGTGEAGDIPYTADSGVPTDGSRVALAWWAENGQYYNNVFLGLDQYCVTGDYALAPRSNYWDYNAVSVAQNGYITTTGWLDQHASLVDVKTAWSEFDPIYGSINSQHDILITEAFLPGYDSTDYKNSKVLPAPLTEVRYGGKDGRSIGAVDYVDGVLYGPGTR